jgi:thiosulfate/3-mercaptopyruvate sulfurtransferase
VQRAGLTPETTVVLYGGKNNWFAAYAYWLLHYLGLGRVKLLNGGRKRWELESREMVTDEPQITPTDFTIPAAERPELRALREGVIANAGGATFVDVRSPEEFRGEMMAPAHLPQESAMVAGHIPGAKNVPWSRAANEDGTFKSAAELQELYGTAGVAKESPVIAYCRIGERSAHTWLVLHELLGFPNVANYDGSWTEYGSLVGVPVEW